MKPLHRPPRGVALIVIVLLIAVGLVIVGSLIESNQLAQARVRNLTREQQASQYASGLEAWGRGMLGRDLEAGSADHLGESWAMPMPPIDVPGGRITGRLEELNGCLNVNALVRNGLPEPVTRARFERLVDNLRLNRDLVDALTDWVDPDSVPMPRGAEDAAYLGQMPAYRTANQPMLDRSELRMVRGIDAKVFDQLSPHLCTLPAGAPINLNTASTMVWMAVVPGLTEPQAENFNERGRARHLDLAGIEQQLLGLNLQFDHPKQLGVSSTHFLAQADIELDGAPFRYFYRFERVGELVRVDRRSRGVF